ncbi:putative E3 ubiquitin-protein ligase RING1a [Phaseolus vulgaris]|uniref:putative E3 ubiquitin-protein ligase RING1a n=1 Tax=Phaseolus vulgaris TaxID=3885 RepID=UPI0035CB73D6
MECLHRFCKECIEKSMRLGINECPICRVRVPSRRSLREDPNFDNLISALVPDIDKYEEQVEASSVQNLPHQTEALDSVSVRPVEVGTDRKQKAKTVAVAFDRMRRSEGKNRTSYARRRINLRNAGKLQVSNENEALNYNNAGKDLCSGEENTETRPRKGGERETLFPKESATTSVDREISSSANVDQSNTVLSDEEKAKQEMSQNVSISRILNNDCVDNELEKDHVGGVQSLGLGSIHNFTFQSTRLSDSCSNFGSAASPQLKEEVVSLRHKLTTVEENLNTLKSVMLTYIQMKEGYIPPELSIIFGDTTNVTDKGSG